jgi:Putative metal-binding motif
MIRRGWLVRGGPRSAAGRAALALGGLALAATLGGCGGDTQILVQVTRDDAAPADIPTLRVYAGVAMPGTSNVEVFVDRSDASAEVDVAGRDLATDPYRLLLQPSSDLPSGSDLQVAALGYQIGTDGTMRPVAFGAIDHAIHFAGGQTLSFGVTLTKIDNQTLVGVSQSGCLDFVVNGQPIHIASHDDWDCDGDPHGTDCDDLDPNINHAATEICGNTVDEDCSGAIDDDTDNDGDGITACGGDCIDNPAAQLPGGLTAKDVHPGATDVPDDTVDQDCNAVCDADATIDADQDHYTTTGILTTPSVAGRCMQSDALVDCNDGDPAINPGQVENPANGLDDDCDGHCDVDADGDGYTKSGYLDAPVMGVCPAIGGDQVDCVDDPSTTLPNGLTAADIHPGAAELCDGIDENCDGKCDDDTDNDGYSVCGTVVDQTGQMCMLVSGGSCDVGEQCDCAPDSAAAHPVPPGGQPVPERCDGYDENCDGVPFPKDNICFVSQAADVCLQGTRQCDDGNPSMPWSACQGDMTAVVNPALCTAYDACFADPTVPDPYACALHNSGVAQVSCTEPVMGNVACVPATFDLPPLIATGCTAATWSIAGGTDQPPWKVGFAAAGGGFADTVIGCTATFAVEAYNGPSNSTTLTRILVVERAGTATASIVVDLTPMSASGCSIDDNLTCQ